METLMALFIIALCYRNTKANATELSECFTGVSHDQFTRLLQTPRCWPTLLWQKFAQPGIGRGGWLEVDDTVLDKFGEHIFGVSWVYSSRLQKVVRGLNLVALIWTDGERRLPVGIKLWRKGRQSKVVLAAKLLRWAHHLGLQPDCVLMDSWYSAKALLKQIRGYGWHFVTRLKKNRNFNGKRLSKHWPHRFGHARGKLGGGIEVSLVKDGKRYLATSDLTLSPRQVKALYRERQQIEEFFKILRGQLRWGQSPARSREAQTAHLHLCLMAYCVLEAEAVRQQTTIYKLRRSLFRQEVPRQSPLLEPFTLAA
ncbi:MAG TPA: transposase [Blastocatellia bacterium]|nr:transposase [Blastocatellia bacterium]